MPAHVKLGAGTDAMRCLRLSDKGVLRWYTDCCRTPIGNTAASPRFPAPAADRRPALVSISHLLKPKLNGFCRRRVERGEKRILGGTPSPSLVHVDQNRTVWPSCRWCSRIHSIPRRAASWSCAGFVKPSTNLDQVCALGFGQRVLLRAAQEMGAASWAGIISCR